MEIITIISYIALTLCVLGVYLIAVPNKNGFHVMNICQVCWIIVACYNKNWAFLIQGIFLFGFNFYGLWNWRRKGVGQQCQRVNQE